MRASSRLLACEKLIMDVAHKNIIFPISTHNLIVNKCELVIANAKGLDFNVCVYAKLYYIFLSGAKRIALYTAGEGGGLKNKYT